MGDRRHVPDSGAIARRALYQAGRSGVQFARLYEFEVEYRDCGMAERSRPEACAGLNRNSSGGYKHLLRQKNLWATSGSGSLPSA
jgi:hypothetical protein